MGERVTAGRTTVGPVTDGMITVGGWTEDVALDSVDIPGNADEAGDDAIGIRVGIEAAGAVTRLDLSCTLLLWGTVASVGGAMALVGVDRVAVDRVTVGLVVVRGWGLAVNGKETERTGKSGPPGLE